MTTLVHGKITVRHSHGNRGTAVVDAEVGPSGIWAVSHAWRHGKPNPFGWVVYHVPSGLSTSISGKHNKTVFHTRKEARRLLAKLEQHGFWRIGPVSTDDFVAAAEAGGARYILGERGAPRPDPSQRVPIQVPLLPEIDEPTPFARRGNPVQVEFRGSLSSGAINELEAMEAEMRDWQHRAEVYYERGEMILAEEADARADALAEYLESYVEEIDDGDVFEERLAWDSVLVRTGARFTAPPELDPDVFPESAEEGIVRIFSDYVRGVGNFYFHQPLHRHDDVQRKRDEELVRLLRLRAAEGCIVAPPEATDDLLVEAARQLWEERELVRATYQSPGRPAGWRRGLSSPGGG